MAEQPIKAPVPVWQSPSPSVLDRGRAGAAADPVTAVPGLDVSAMNRELLDYLHGPTGRMQTGSADAEGALTPAPGGLADELSMLGNRLNGDTRQLIRDRERDAQLSRGLRHLSNAMLTTGK